MNRGTLYGIAAYALWGLFPIYWKALGHVAASEVLVHRMIWSLVFVALILTWRGQWAWLVALRRRPRAMAVSALAAILLGVNWFLYIWGVTHDFVVETSLGYFITPILSVLLGVLLLRERLRGGQWAAVALAAVGVFYLTLVYGSLPWIALTLAFTFGLYGYLKKRVSLSSLESLTAEMMALFTPALIYLLWLMSRGEAAFSQADAATHLLLVAAGMVTAVPLLLFGAAARRVPLSALGILQYLAPTLQFLLGVLLYHEPFTTAHLTGFILIWLALAVYTIDGLRHRQPRPSAHHGGR